jgi:shikimate kinase / 3-dehydroquinate synthase
VGSDRPGRRDVVATSVRPNIVLIGFMGTGKTAIGEAAAARLGYSFVDTDALIETQAGRSISQIFADDGEPAFRRLETQVVEAIAAQGGSVIATGGGVPLREENMRHLRRNGLIVALHATPEAILARLEDGADRPLLGVDPEGSVRRLLKEREAVYRAADLAIETSSLPVEVAADRIVAFVRAQEQTARAGLRGSVSSARAANSPPSSEHAAGPAVEPVDLRQITVDLGARLYEVWIGQGLLQQTATHLGRCGIRGRLALVTHPRIEALYGRALAAHLQAAGYEVVPISVPPAESSKSLRVAERVYGALIDARFDREAAVLALGGGVAGDLGGFVAATFLRGIRWVALPTTLLAMVDAGIGGKTGINLRGKNLIGAVHQPAVVLADIGTLRSLPLRELRSGMAEVVKTGMIGDPALFECVEVRGRACLRRDLGLLAWIVGRCASYKAGVVVGDERESGGRMVLNYGHTVGHAIEAAAGYRGMTHGEAISVGMTYEARLAARLGLCDSALVDRQTQVLEALGLPVRLGAIGRGGSPAPDRVHAAMFHDKKASAGRLRFVLPEALGRVTIRDDVPSALVDEVLGGD